MRIAVLGGCGAMGGLFGGMLAAAGNLVTLVDIAQEAVDAINAHGLRLQDKISGHTRTVEIQAKTDPAEVGVVELVLTFVKCYHTEAAVRSALPMIGPDTLVLTLQNGWGNAERIASIAGRERVLAGLTYHSATLVEPGWVLHTGKGPTFVGELDGAMSERLEHLVEVLRQAGFEVSPTAEVLKEVYQKLALNACTLPTAALLRFQAHKLVEHEGTLSLMRGLLKEVVAVAQAQKVALDEEERWQAITGLLRRAVGAKGSMLQDVERQRRTEIDVINGAIVEAGKRLGIHTPYNETMVWLVKSLEETFVSAQGG